MSNQTSALDLSLSLETPSLDQLLDSLGFVPWKTITASVVIPTISSIGIILCSLSVWIFFRKKFKDPVFFYYRLLCFVYIIHLIHNIPYGLLFSPRYISNINTYLSSVYLIYYFNLASILFHFEETLQMAILLTRMKIFSPFVREHFSSKPWVISLNLFLTSIFIHSLGPFALKLKSFGTYSYYDNSKKDIKKIATFYYFSSSDFSVTLLGQILLTFTLTFLNLFLSTFISIILNVVSVHMYKKHVNERREKEKAYTKIAYNRNQATTNVIVVKSRARTFSQKEMNENKSENNMLKMALTLCSISIGSKVALIFVFIYFFFFNSFSETLILLLMNALIYALVPSSSIFIFYSFNKMFRDEIRDHEEDLHFLERSDLEPNSIDSYSGRVSKSELFS